jgi:hypothetical protein
LIYPCTTLMDLSIGTALHIASEGKGRLFTFEGEEEKEESKGENLKERLVELGKIHLEEFKKLEEEWEKQSKGIEEEKQVKVEEEKKQTQGKKKREKGKNKQKKKGMDLYQNGVGVLCESLSLINLQQYMTREITSKAKVLLSGHGADEIFGGYGRYFVQLRKKGMNAVQKEMQLGFPFFFFFFIFLY